MAISGCRLLLFMYFIKINFIILFRHIFLFFKRFFPDAAYIATKRKMSFMDTLALPGAKRMLAACADLLMPRTCIVCGKKLLPDEKMLCLHCRMNLPLTHFWERTHNPMADRFNDILQKRLEKEWSPERYAYACALFFYDSDGDYRHITQNIKYNGDIPAGKHFGRMLGSVMASCPHLEDISIVIPVPLHWRRKWKRGYNQAEVIAGGLACALGAEMKTDMLKRIRPTRSQTKLDVKGKEANVRDAFRAARTEGMAAPEGFSEGHFLLVDDVFTTGSTLLACFTALRAVFPPSVRISVATLGFVGQ